MRSWPSLGWQVLSVDLPEHGGRQDGAPLLPWAAVPELQAVDALEEITALLSRNPDELLSGNTAE